LDVLEPDSPSSGVTPVRRTLILVITFLFSAGAAASAAAAQSVLVLDVRGGLGIPVGSFSTGPDSGGDVGPAASLGLQFVLRRGSHLGFYAGFTQVRFDCGEDGCPGEGVYVSTAWDLGVHVVPVDAPWSPWIRAGLVLARVERDFREGGEVLQRVSDLGAGGEVGVGFRVPLGRRLTLRPGVRYTVVEADYGDAGTLRMRYLVVDVGLALGF
jgi:hypothetical protein